MHKADGSIPLEKESAVLYSCIIFISSQGSSKNDVVSTFSPHENIDFTGFSENFQDTAVADEKYFNHVIFSPEML